MCLDLHKDTQSGQYHGHIARVWDDNKLHSLWRGGAVVSCSPYAQPCFAKICTLH